MKTRINTKFVNTLAALVVLSCASVGVAGPPQLRFAAPQKYNSMIGLKFEEMSASWGGYLKVYSTDFNSVARQTGFESGDEIARINGVRVQTAEDLNRVLRNSPRVAQVQVRNVRNGQWIYVTMTVPQIGPPLPPHFPNHPNNPPPQNNPGWQPQPAPVPQIGTPNPAALRGRWNTNLGTSITLTQIMHSNRLTGTMFVPVFGASNLNLAVNGQTSRIDLIYSRVDGRDNGTGQLTMVSPNRLEGYFINRHGVQVSLTLTR